MLDFKHPGQPDGNHGCLEVGNGLFHKVKQLNTNKKMRSQFKDEHPFGTYIWLIRSSATVSAT